MGNLNPWGRSLQVLFIPCNFLCIPLYMREELPVHSLALAPVLPFVLLRATYHAVRPACSVVRPIPCGPVVYVLPSFLFSFLPFLLPSLLPSFLFQIPTLWILCLPFLLLFSLSHSSFLNEIIIMIIEHYTEHLQCTLGKRFNFHISPYLDTGLFLCYTEYSDSFSAQPERKFKPKFPRKISVASCYKR